MSIDSTAPTPLQSTPTITMMTAIPSKLSPEDLLAAGADAIITPQTPETTTSSDKPKLSIVAQGQEASIPLGKEDTVLTEKLDDVWQKLQALTGSMGGRDPYIRTFTGKNAGEIVVAIYYTDAKGKKEPLLINPNDSNYIDFTTLKDKMRDLHRELIGIPAQREPFQGLFIPKFKNDSLHFFESGHFDKMNAFIKAKGLENKLPSRQAFARIKAAQTWIETALNGVDALIQLHKKEIIRLDQSLVASDREIRAKKAASLNDLESVLDDLKELSQNTDSQRPQRLMMNWVIGMNTTLGDFQQAELTQEGLLKILTEEDEKTAKESSFSPKNGHLNPFGKKTPNSLDARREYSHSAGALPLYHDEAAYIRWCDHFGRQMKSDSTVRLVISYILNALSNNPEKAGSPLLLGAHLSCNEDLKDIFEKATIEASQTYYKTTFDAVGTDGTNTGWRDWIDPTQNKKT